MKMEFNSLSISIRVLLMAYLSKLARGLSVGSSFDCGPVTCDRKGYDRCIAPPLIGAKDRPYCLRCEEPDAKCGTIHELGDCNLFCHEVILERELQKVTATDCTNTTPHHSEDGFHMTRKGSILFIVVIVFVGALMCFLCVYAMKLRSQLLKHTRENDISVSSPTISSADDEESHPLETLITQPSECREMENTEVVPS